MVCQRERILRSLIAGKLNSPGWMAGYAWRIASITGWGYREIMEELPFSAGLQILHADDYANGRARIWSRDKKAEEFDSLALIEDAFSKITTDGHQDRPYEHD